MLQKHKNLVERTKKQNQQPKPGKPTQCKMSPTRYLNCAKVDNNYNDYKNIKNN